MKRGCRERGARSSKRPWLELQLGTRAWGDSRRRSIMSPAPRAPCRRDEERPADDVSCQLGRLSAATRRHAEEGKLVARCCLWTPLATPGEFASSVSPLSQSSDVSPLALFMRPRRPLQSCRAHEVACCASQIASRPTTSVPSASFSSRRTSMPRRAPAGDFYGTRYSRPPIPSPAHLPSLPDAHAGCSLVRHRGSCSRRLMRHPCRASSSGRGWQAPVRSTAPALEAPIAAWS